MSLTVKLNGPVLDPGWHVDDLGLEDIVLAYLAARTAAASVPLELAEGGR